MKTSKDQFQELRQQDINENLHEGVNMYFTPPKEESRLELVSKALPSLLSLDAAAIDTLARVIVQDVADGNKDALEVLITAKKGAAFFKAIDDNVKNFAYGKHYASKGENVVKFGCKVEPAELGVAYDYQSTGDEVYNELNNAFYQAKLKKEEREKFLKSIKGSITVVDEDTGDVIKIKEPIKKGQLGYKITIT